MNYCSNLRPSFRSPTITCSSMSTLKGATWSSKKATVFFSSYNPTTSTLPFDGPSKNWFIDSMVLNRLNSALVQSLINLSYLRKLTFIQSFVFFFLKKQVGELIFTTKDLATTINEGIVLLHPHQILDTHWLKKGSKFMEQSLVQWKNMPAEDAT